MKKLLIAFIIGIFAEIAAFLLLGKQIGILPTLALIMLTSVIGGIVIKKMGTESIRSIRTSISRGEAPAVAVIEGILVMLGAILLLFPGFISDIFAILLIMPFTRKLFLPIIFANIRKWISKQNVIVYHR